jgi:hypothetical protein
MPSMAWRPVTSFTSYPLAKQNGPLIGAVCILLSESLLSQPAPNQLPSSGIERGIGIQPEPALNSGGQAKAGVGASQISCCCLPFDCPFAAGDQEVSLAKAESFPGFDFSVLYHP